MTTTCSHVRRVAEPDRPLPHGLQAHLADCASCRAYIEDLARLRRMLAELADVPVPEDFRDRLRRRVHAASPESRRSLGFGPRVAAWAAAAGIAAALVLTLLSVREPHGPTVTRAPVLSPRESSSDTAARSEGPRGDQKSAALSVTPDVLSQRLAVHPAMARTRHPTFPGRKSSPPAVEERASALIPDDRSLSEGVILLLRDEETHEESIIAIPPIVFGSRPLMPRTTSAVAVERRRIL